MKRLLSVFLYIVTAGVLSAQTVPVILSLGSQTGVYAKGEEASVFATLTEEYDEPLSVRVTSFGKRVTSSNNVMLEKDVPVLVYKGSFDVASSVNVSVGNPQNRKSFISIGFVVAPEEFRPGFQEPADLMAFWDSQKEELRRYAMDVRKTLVYQDSALVCYDLEINMPEGNPVRGYLAMPSDAMAGSLPIALIAHAAGVQKPHCRSSSDTAIEWARKGCISFDMNAHGMLNGQPQEYYDQLGGTTLKDYAVQPLTTHKDFYFRLMYLRLIRAMDYLTSLKEWDGKRALVRGESQGAGQAGALAALDPRISMSVMIVPALADIGGALDGDRGGWPSYYAGLVADSQTRSLAESILPYYDVALLIRYARAEIVMECGLIDMVCKPECVYSAFNNAENAASKIMLTYPHRPHHRVAKPHYEDWQQKVDNVRNSLINAHIADHRN